MVENTDPRELALVAELELFPWMLVNISATGKQKWRKFVEHSQHAALWRIWQSEEINISELLEWHVTNEFAMREPDCVPKKYSHFIISRVAVPFEDNFEYGDEIEFGYIYVIVRGP